MPHFSSRVEELDRVAGDDLAFAGPPDLVPDKAGPPYPIVLVHGRPWSSRPDFDLQVPGMQRSVLQSLADRGINIQAISTSEIKVSVLIDSDETELAVRVLHTAYGLDAA